jgi:Holliday junction resolvase RusA-like endonuclease
MRFEVPGKPFAKQRPRFNRKTGRVYTPDQTVTYEGMVARRAADMGLPVLEGPVRLKITAIFEPAKSWSKQKRADHLWNPHTQKPDLDNIEKAIMDALNGVAFKDDSQVCDKVARKMWGSTAKTIVEVEPITTFSLRGY